MKMAVNTRLFVGNLPDNINEHALREAFSSYGEIIKFDLKCKPDLENENDSKKRFAFVTISASNFHVETCIKHFSCEDFHGNRLYVTRARESFLERLQRERQQSRNNDEKKNEEVQFPADIKGSVEYQKTLKRKCNNEDLKSYQIKKCKVNQALGLHWKQSNTSDDSELNNRFNNKLTNNHLFQDEKRQNSDKQRQESIKKKRQDFNEKKIIIKTGLLSIDKQFNNKIIFSDSEQVSAVDTYGTVDGRDVKHNKCSSALFGDEGSDVEINFDIKEQYEGKRGQKVLDLQSRFKSDKRFVLDERFVEDSECEQDVQNEEEEVVDLKQADEKSKQLNILQDLLGYTIKSKSIDNTNKTKTKLGMLRFDPTQPEHAKYLVPVTAEQHTRKSKKINPTDSKFEGSEKEPESVVETVEVSKEQFYTITDTLKDITKPSTFSLRSLFTREGENQQHGADNEHVNYIPLQTNKDVKYKNPLDPGTKNPFMYDSSESDNEEDSRNNSAAPGTREHKAVWREKLFLSITDQRLKDGLIFFSNPHEQESQKERRNLKSLMKKRIHNKERKSTMFQKKIGGRTKIIRKKFRKN